LPGTLLILPRGGADATERLPQLLFQYRARVRPGLTLEQLLEEEAGERSSDDVQQMHQDAPGACPAAPAEAMTLDVK